MKYSQIFLILSLLTVSVQPAKILTVMTFNSTSHHSWLASLASTLANRGHLVTAVDVQHNKNKSPNLKTEILAEPPPKVAENMQRFVQALDKGTTLERMHALQENTVIQCEALFETSPFKEMISPEYKETFDLIIYNFNQEDCLLGLIHRFGNPPVILSAPFSTNPHWIYRILHTPIFHAVPHYFDSNHAMPLNFFQRLRTLLFYLYDDYVYKWHTIPQIDIIVKRYLGDKVPSVATLAEDNVALGFVNARASDYRVPLPANVIPIAGLHMAKPKPLPADLQEWLDGAKDGVIVMSFGSIVRGDSIAPEKRQAILNAFARVPQRVLWKWESTDEGGNVKIPPNVKLSKWLPQNDILAHPNARLFISHCGGMSSVESAYHGVPVMAVPFFLDQLVNADRVVAEGRGLRLDINDINPETFYKTLRELLDNPKYRETALQSKAVLQDEPMHPIDRAVFWVEFVLRHRQNGTRRMRSPAADLPWAQMTLLLDIFILSAAALSLLSLILIGVWYAIAAIRKRCFTSASTKKASATETSKKRR